MSGTGERAAGPRRTQAERRSRTREQLLDAAGAVFAARGYHAATLEQIAERAGVSKGSVYYNFASKHELFVTLLSERIAQRLGDVREALGDPAPGEPPAHAAGVSFLGAVSADPRWGPLFFEFVAQAARDDEVRAAFAAWLSQTREALAALIRQRLHALGHEPALPPERLAILVSALANGMLIEHIFDPRGVPPELFGEGLALLADAATDRR